MNKINEVVFASKAEDDTNYSVFVYKRAYQEKDGLKNNIFLFDTIKNAYSSKGDWSWDEILLGENNLFIHNNTSIDIYEICDSYGIYVEDAEAFLKIKGNLAMNVNYDAVTYELSEMIGGLKRSMLFNCCIAGGVLLIFLALIIGGYFVYKHMKMKKKRK